ncbi:MULTISPECIES: autotransporter strand-loop-strand O-heptosyltransferase [Paraburkholderia]|uniref:Autotransporter strand-loop-strand O-heptosyltransferase n=1 Tax=Paraburkholderia megapolitana TaxID=420953 RepID=A0A1I3SK80_9BURK|nr:MULTISPECIES: autotransporter strand-loop-strand O-heptosyltransferase [Paraburkholderia]MCX4166166.1 autotransporter strand-loop-strand O-heptosyltransferase [Paraburkholderia megapolitana]MDN7161656.1 autotransporter strand-loop-strand O-heptosyltransferase [Paraburkholderia sp. CHISQ3]MDQ6498704.1 autotransporter strand-loop-strand O-heptosyltransferase [Paraburkholderia megapolitana]QDQ85661.1 autotransporter strand-loop-strand O-heptosyltransferase [Paraburkholderia megapolitana]SFJ591
MNSDVTAPVADTSAPGAPVSGFTARLPQTPAYPPPANVPTQQGPAGICFDFNDGCRVTLPAGNWRVCLRDCDTGNVLFETEIARGYVASTRKYYARFEILVWARVALARDSKAPPTLHHVYDASGKEVLVQFPVGTIGDTIGWMPYAAAFQRRHGCRLTCAMSEKLIPLFRDAYPQIGFVTHEQVQPQRYYATYSLGLFFDDDEKIHQPSDFRLVGLHRTAGYILGVDPREEPPEIALPDDTRPIDEPYVCIAVQSSTQCKYWNNPTGWHDVIAFLKEAGYRVVCIDQKKVHGTGMAWNHIPHGVEDETGDRPLVERARWLKHAAFFIGLSSGLSWLAWAVRTPAVMISGFTHPVNEFHTPYRVINYHVCNSCWNDPRVRFDHHDFLWCPRHKDTPRQFECTRLIESKQVIDAIRTIPGVLR